MSGDRILLIEHDIFPPMGKKWRACCGLTWMIFASFVAGGPAWGEDPQSASGAPSGGLRAACESIARKLASVQLQECLSLGLELSGGRSVLGTPILHKEYPPLAGRKPLGRVLLFGGIHGDEYSSVTIVLKWMAILNRFHSGLFHWQMVPLLNPDGLLRRRSQRMNEHGVDLNRNFPCPNWLAATQDYWIRRTGRNLRRYPGSAPLVEPESRWLADEIERFRPDVIVSVHAPHGVVDFDGPPKAPARLGSLELKLLGTYPGSLGRYAGVKLELPVVTLELPSAGSMPSSTEQIGIWRDLVRWLRHRLPADRARRAAAAKSD